MGASLTVIAWHKRCGERTIQNRIDQSLDAMRQDVNRASMAPLAEINPTGYFRN